MSRSKLGGHPLVVIMGSTGTGKSDLAVELAVRFKGEIINADAMQMYRGLPVTTNQISTEERRGIPHHLLDTIETEEEPWKVGRFKKEATRVIQEIRSRGNLPIVVGGSQYYIDGLLFENRLVESDPATDADGDTFHDSQETLQPTEDDHAEKGEEDETFYPDNAKKFPVLDGPTEDMLAMLREVDPVMAERWHPKDRRKIKRSLEIFLTTGKRASDIYAEQRLKKAAQVQSAATTATAGDAAAPWPFLLFWVYSRPKPLMERLDARIETMLKREMVYEQCMMCEKQKYIELESGPVDRSKGIWQSIGVKQMKPFVEELVQGPYEGKPETARKYNIPYSWDINPLLEYCLDNMRSATRRYAKYQLRWIKHKTIPLLAEEKALDRLFLLDSTDKERWQEAVAATAVRLTETYLAKDKDGQKLPAPADLSDTARDVLTGTIAASLRAADSKKDGKPYRQTCDICNTTLMSEDEWTKHINGRRHRRTLKKHKRLALVPVSPKTEEKATDAKADMDAGAEAQEDHPSLENES